MKTILTRYLVAVIAITFAITGCDKAENEISVQEKLSNSNLIETDYFSGVYIFTDTLRLFTANNNYVDIIVSSDDKDVLDSHLKMNLYEVNEMSDSKKLNSKVSIQNSIERKRNNIIGYEDIDIRNLKKISIEVLECSENINSFDIRCIKKVSDLSESKMQKVPFSTSPMYYEYTSGKHEGYGQLKYTNDANVPGTSRRTGVRYGSKSCWLCGWKTFPSGQFAYLDHTAPGYLYDTNTFGYDGADCQGNIYKLCTGVISFSPYNHWTRFEKNAFTANW